MDEIIKILREIDSSLDELFRTKLVGEVLEIVLVSLGEAVKHEPDDVKQRIYERVADLLRKHLMFEQLKPRILWPDEVQVVTPQSYGVLDSVFANFWFEVNKEVDWLYKIVINIIIVSLEKEFKENLDKKSKHRLLELYDWTLKTGVVIGSHYQRILERLKGEKLEFLPFKLPEWVK